MSYLDIEGDSLALMLEFNRGVISASLVRRDVLTSVPPVPPGQRPGDDYLLFCHVATRCEWQLVARRLAYYRVHDGQDTHKDLVPGENGLIKARLRAWEVCGPFSRRPLRDYGPGYRAELRHLLWQLAKRGAFGEARSAFLLSLPLLPRQRDRLGCFVPDPLVWHAQRALGRFRSGDPARQPGW